MRRWAVSTALVLVCGCAEWALVSEGDRSVGAPNSGWLEHGVAIPERGDGFVRSRPGDPTRFGHRRLVRAIETAASEVARVHPGGAPLRVGDIAGDGGGDHDRHASHRTGRDVDLAFFVVDLDGRSVTAGTAAFDRHGVARDSNGTLVRFDAARNWSLVRSFLADDALAVQWIFCSNGVKSLLLRHARSVERDPDLLVRASAVLHQPTNARPHDDHFHIRITCDARDVALGCRDFGPRWPWLRAALEPSSPAPIEDDAAVLMMLVDDEQTADGRDL